ncbi:MAG: hypothetical protein O3C15_09565 [Proteobacteria bacterium]|nr:hypothetical protein [Pseudomonadota bacterium]
MAFFIARGSADVAAGWVRQVENHAAANHPSSMRTTALITSPDLGSAKADGKSAKLY